MDVDFPTKPVCGPVSSSDILIFLISTVYLLPLIVGYCIVLRHVFWRGRKSSFFKLYTAQVSMLLLACLGELQGHFLRAGLICDVILTAFWRPSNFLAVWAYYPTLYCPLALSSVGLLISLNRLSAVIFPFRYDQLWSRIFVWSIVGSILIPCVPSHLGIISPAFVKPMTNRTSELAIFYYPVKLLGQSLLYTSIYNIFIATSILLVTVWTTVAIAKLGMSNMKKLERSCLAYGISSSLSVIFWTAGRLVVFVTVYWMPDPVLGPMALNIREPMLIVGMATPLLAMLGFCKEVRRDVLGKKTASTVAVSTEN